MADEPAASRLDAVRARLLGAWAHVRAWVRSLSLRARLLAVTLVLVAVGLTVAGAATYGSLRSFLLDRVDTQLVAAQRPAADGLYDYLRNSGNPFGPGGHAGQLPYGIRGALYSPSGILDFYPPAPPPFSPSGNGFRTVSAGSDGGEYRWLSGHATPVFGHLVVTQDGPYSFVIGVPLGDVNSTLGRLLVIEILVGLGVLAAVGGAGYWLVRAGLRPLRGIEETATAIAAGDLSRRIDEAPSTTEVGRLGGALNTMLGTIEQAFAERTESERRLRQFVADASHELQTPLTSVRGYAELFRRGAADRPEDLANAMRRIEAEAERMGVLVDDLLLLARLDQGRPIERAPVDLTRLTTELVGDARVVDPSHPIEVRAPEPVVIEADELRIRQVVSNLLSNVRTHTPPGTPVTVTVGRDDGSAVIEVADRGPGMPADHAARVFERFFRADASRTRASGGTGLGLAIVAAIAEAHGGAVTVESAPGDGARFRVTLPAAPPPPVGRWGEAGPG